MIQRTVDNVEKLAREVVDSWDMDTLISMAIETLIMNYHNDEYLFDEDILIMDFKEEQNA